MNLKCKLGFHKWVIKEYNCCTSRECSVCEKDEIYDYINDEWFDVTEIDWDITPAYKELFNKN
jgi:hypothetical protein